MSQDTLATVRERIAGAKAAAFVAVDCGHGAYLAPHIDFLAKMLEAVLEAAPCEKMVAARGDYDRPCDGLRDDEHDHVRAAGRDWHSYRFPAWLEAALTRATATTEVK